MGYHLTSAKSSHEGQKPRARFYYGEAIDPPAPNIGSAGPPIALFVYPICVQLLDRASESYWIGKDKTLRGGAIVRQRRDGAVYVWTDDVFINLILTVDFKRGPAAVNELRGVGQVSGHISPSDPLPPPDFSKC